MARSTFIIGLGSIIIGQFTIPTLADVVTDVVSIMDTTTITSCADTVTDCPSRKTATSYPAVPSEASEDSSYSSFPGIASQVTSEASSLVSSTSAALPLTVTVTQIATGDCGMSSTSNTWTPPVAAASGNYISILHPTSFTNSHTAPSTTKWSAPSPTKAWNTAASWKSGAASETGVASSIAPSYADGNSVSLSTYTPIRIHSYTTTYYYSTVQTKTSGSTIWTTTTGWTTVSTCLATSSGGAYATGYSTGGYGTGTGTLIGPYGNSSKTKTGMSMSGYSPTGITSAMDSSATANTDSDSDSSGSDSTMTASSSTASGGYGYGASHSTLVANPPTSNGMGAGATGLNGTTGAQQTTISGSAGSVRVGGLAVAGAVGFFLFGLN